MNFKFVEIPQFFSLPVVRRALFVGVALFGVGIGACDSKSVGDEKECKVGDTKEVDCNTCTCEAGQWACTEKACAAYDPCEGSTCGDACTLCDPNDKDCFETLELKACDAMGQCVSDTGDLCGGAECKDGDTKKAAECNECGCYDGYWACTEKGCDGYEPCLGSSCGEACTLCDPNDKDCFETLELKACDADGACVPEVPDLCEGGYAPCATKTCGDSCTICDPADKDCIETEVIKACDADGVCVAEVPDLCEPAYQPCADKSCGEMCKICDPKDEDCVETQEVKVCDAEGQCVADTGDICE